jgi:diguanylate cyclase (GGDEF)-like protein
MEDENNTTRVKTNLIDNNLRQNNALDAYLIVVCGEQLGCLIGLDRNKIVIGRSEKADIRIDETNVSRVHAVIVKDNNGFTIIDENSTNGTFINTVQQRKASLKDQDVIVIGNTALKFIAGDNIEKNYYEELYNLAVLDGLLQIYNRKHFIKRLSEEFQRSQRYGRNLSLIMLDLDRFKRINDTYGHQAGDDVLKAVADILKRNLREQDVLGRYGGEEFAIMLPETPLEHTLAIAERLRSLIEEATLTYRQQRIFATISLGAASYCATDNRLPYYQDLIEKADGALLMAKRTGRNKVVSADESN